jgi:hypothetical protein
MKIDAFAHVLPPRYRERVIELLRARGDQSATDYEHMLQIDPTLTDLDERFRLMDEIGPDYRQVLVMAHTSVEHEEPETAAALARIGNEDLAGLVAAHPDRFAGWVARPRCRTATARSPRSSERSERELWARRSSRPCRAVASTIQTTSRSSPSWRSSIVQSGSTPTARCGGPTFPFPSRSRSTVCTHFSAGRPTPP